MAAVSQTPAVGVAVKSYAPTAEGEQFGGSKSHARPRHHAVSGGIHGILGRIVFGKSPLVHPGGGIDRSFHLGLPKNQAVGKIRELRSLDQ